ncbi:MAG: amidohydrolase [Clostridiales bacterium]|nr:amidohydrolase [Bacillota bacterium]MEE0517058.1 amidohydrolase [Anaerovoracaceae bacterium]PWL93210.1 MAG: amidohydrolase [Clostridiales bacterium]
MNEIIKNRREFHKYAETSWDEVRTSARIAQILEGYGVKKLFMGTEAVNKDTLKYPIELSEKRREDNIKRAVLQGASEEYVKRTDGYPGVVAVIDTQKPGPSFALRFDIDCLPYEEECDIEASAQKNGYKSVNSGCTHACGHDAHTAIGLELARRITENIDQYAGIIKIIFQPAEETTLGAASIVDKGHLDDIDYFIAVHLALSAENVPLPSHTVACGVKDFMSCRALDVTFHGKAAHPCGAAQEGKNALLAACSAALNLHSIAHHEKGLCRVNVGRIEGGVCTNTIAPECTIELEYRGQYKEITDYLTKRVFDILDGSARAYDLKYTYVDHGEVPAGCSDDELMEVVKQAAEVVPWFEKIYFEGNLGGTDDAAVMMNKVQEQGGMGVYIGIGTDITNPLHHPAFDFDEECLEAAVELLEETIKLLIMN